MHWPQVGLVTHPSVRMVSRKLSTERFNYCTSYYLLNSNGGNNTGMSSCTKYDIYYSRSQSNSDSVLFLNLRFGAQITATRTWIVMFYHEIVRFQSICNQVAVVIVIIVNQATIVFDQSTRLTTIMNCHRDCTLRSR